MSTISQIHNEAMARLQLANQVLKKGRPGAYKTMLNEALVLEKKAAYALVNDFDCEPTRSVLFRSAAAIAFNAANYDDAVILATQGLSGNPFTEIKNELEDLLSQAKSQVTEYLSILHDDGAVYNEKSIILSTSVTAKHSLYDNATDLAAYEITEQKESISSFFAKTKASYTEFFEQWMFDLFLGREKIRYQVQKFLREKLPLLTTAIGKEDTRWIWYSKEYLETVYEAINYLDADGVRIYFGQFEEEHPEYARQTCLIWIPTRPVEHTWGGSDDIIIEDDRAIPEASFLNRYYIKKEIVNKRILNYRNTAYRLLSEAAAMASGATGMEETRSIWYSRKYIDYIITTMHHLDASGVRVYFGCYANANPEEIARDFVDNQLSLLFVLTRQGSNSSVHQNIVIEKDESFSNIPETFGGYGRENESRNIDSLIRHEPPYAPLGGSKFPF
jgi:hypothetical protein